MNSKLFFNIIRVNELYEYQKLIWENMEDISNTLSVHGNLADRLTNDYDSLILMLENNNAQLQEEICNVVPDEKCINNFLYYKTFFYLFNF